MKLYNIYYNYKNEYEYGQTKHNKSVFIDKF